MKKYFLGAAALLALTACSNDETVDLNQDGNVISFAVTANNPSRAITSEVFNPNALPTDFTVYAAYDGKTYFQNETFIKQGSNYNSNKTHYWPAVDGEKKVTFVAFRNAGDNLSTNFIWKPNAASTLSYTVPATAATQTDFIYAVTKSQRPTGTDGQVNLNFRHALAQVVFKAQVTNPNLYVEIVGVSVCNAKNKGTFTFPFDKVTDVNHDDDQERAFDFDATTQGSWSVQDDSQTNYALTFDKVGIANGHTENLTAHDAARETDANTLLLLPQNTAAWNLASKPSSPSQKGAYFLVKCRIRNVANGTSVDEDNDVYLWGSSSEYKEVAVPATFDWKQGKKYIITFVFGNGNGGYNPEPDTPEPVLVPISFNVSVDDFAKVTGEVKMEEP